MRKLKYTFVIALMFLVSFVKSQNTGPVSPEAVAFEPVDVTDMVNLVTGDFTYVIPLLTVPSPEGGYPIALSYHGGITMDQEASWIGLGWNINPGAINRKVNGVPDDWNEKIKSTAVYMAGNPTEVTSIGIGVTLGSKAILSVGLSYSWGDYKGFNGQVGLGYNSGNANIGVNYSNRTGFSLNGGVGLDSRSINSIGFMINDNGMDVNLKNNILKTGVGITLSSENLNGGVTISGIGSAVSAHDQLSGEEGLVETKIVNNQSVSLGIFYLSYDYYFKDYYYFNQYNDIYYGALYSKDARNQMDEDDITTQYYGGVQDKEYKMDTYIIPNNSEANFDQKNRERSNNLMFAAYDNYVGSAQGLSGQFSPKLFSETLLTGDSYFTRLNKSEEVYYMYWSPIMNNTTDVHPNFYFDNEITGYLNDVPGEFVLNGSASWDNLDYINESRNSNLTIDSKVYNGYVNNRKVSGNYIEWFTNKEIVDGDAALKGFIETDELVSIRNEANPNYRLEIYFKLEFDPDGIGAFKITTLDGKTYHYSLPVYQFEDVVRKNGKKDGDYAEKLNFNKYAYTWLLTAITGPDYIDRGTIGIIDDEDYGYWMKFNYGKIPDAFIWQFPYNLDGESYNTYKKEIQWGRKQIYYLNKIESRSHVAYFIKSKRLDGSGKPIWYSESRYANNPITEYFRYSVNIYTPVNPLKLDKIILLNKSKNYKIEIDPSKGDIDHGKIKSTYFPFDYSLKGYSGIYMDENITNLDNLINNAVKVIDFGYDYSLCKNTPNSDAENKAKLTLTKVEFKGSKGLKALPSYIFNYNKSHGNSYNINDKDEWGYLESNPDEWSLNEIVLPLGSKINVFYEPNIFNKEAIYRHKLPVTESKFIQDQNKWGVKLSCDIKSINVGDRFKLKGIMEYGYFVYDPDYYPLKVLVNQENNSSSVYDFIEITEVDYSSKFIYFNHPSGWATINLPADGDNIDIYSRLSGAYCEIENNLEQRGGGARVKEIQMEDDSKNTFSTLYDYSIPGTDLTSGTIMYSIYGIEKKYVPYFSELPIPKVIYNFVTVSNKNKIDFAEISTLYEFEGYNYAVSPNSDLVIENQFEVENKQNTTKLCEIINENVHKYSIYGRSSIIKSNLNSIGRLKSVTVLNKINNILSKTNYDYYKPQEITVGLNQETYNYSKIYLDYDCDASDCYEVGYYPSSKNIVNYNATSKIIYPSILKSKKTTSNGLTTINRNTKHDFYSGNVLQTETELYNGKIYRTDILPAYRIDSYYAEMGPKALDESSKNMLSQEAASIHYKLNNNGVNWDPIGVNIQTWNNIWKYREYESENYLDKEITDVWRKHKQFVWKGDMAADGTYSSDFNTYATPDVLAANWADLETVTDKWQQVNKITRYNHYSMPLESKDINGNYASAKMDMNNEKVMATVANADYLSFTYTGFEEEKKDYFYFGGEVGGDGDRIKSNINAHTGDYYLSLVSGEEVTYSFKNFVKGKTYNTSVWARVNSSNQALLRVTGAYPFNFMRYIDHQSALTMGDWKLLSIDFKVPLDYTGTEIEISLSTSSGIAYFDDFRLHPIDAPMQSYVYDQHTGAVTAILDNNNIATKYEYDDAGKLKAVYKEIPGIGTAGGFKKVSEHNYGYARPLNAFELINASATATINPNGTGARNVLLRVDVKNNDFADQICSINCGLAGADVQYLSKTIGADETTTFYSFWALPSGNNATRKISITGDIEHALNVNLPSTSPADVRFVSYAITGTEATGELISTATFENLGGSPGYSNAIEYVYFSNVAGSFSETDPNVNVYASRNIGILVNPGGTSASSILNYSLEDNGYYFFRLKQGNVTIGSRDIHVTSATPPPPGPKLSISYDERSGSPYDVFATLSNVTNIENIHIELQLKVAGAGVTINPANGVYLSPYSPQASFTVTTELGDGVQVRAVASGGALSNTLYSPYITLTSGGGN